MQEKYAILREYSGGLCGHLYITGSSLKIELNRYANIEDIPTYFKKNFLDRIFTVEHEKVLYWIKTRIPPQYRQDINDVLKSLGLMEYNEIKMFKAYRGKSVRDDYYIERV